MLKLRYCSRTTAVLLPLLSLAVAACKSLDIGVLHDAHRAVVGGRPYKNYTGPNAARIRVVYGTAHATIKIDPKSPETQSWRIPTGKRTNKEYMGLLYKQAPILLGMPATQREFDYTEIAVPPGIPISIEFSWVRTEKRFTESCHAASELVPMEGTDYEVTYIRNWDNGVCAARTTRL